MNLTKLKFKSLLLTGLLVFIAALMHFLSPADILDARIFYTSGQADAFFSGLDSSGRRAYFANEMLDLVFLTIYSFLFYFLCRRFYFRRLWFAFAPGIFDLIETVTMIFLLLNPSWLAPVWLGYVTSFKWASGIVVVLAIFMGFLRSRRTHS